MLEENVLFNDALNSFHFTVVWRRTYGKGLFRLQDMKPVSNKDLLYAQDGTYHGFATLIAQ